MKTNPPLNLLPWQERQKRYRNRRYFKIGALSIVLLTVLLSFSEGLLIWREVHLRTINHLNAHQLNLLQPALRYFNQLTLQQHQRAILQQRLSQMATQRQHLLCHLHNVTHTLSQDIVLHEFKLTATTLMLKGQVTTESSFNAWLEHLSTTLSVLVNHQQLKPSLTQPGDLDFQLDLTITEKLKAHA